MSENGWSGMPDAWRAAREDLYRRLIDASIDPDGPVVVDAVGPPERGVRRHLGDSPAALVALGLAVGAVSSPWLWMALAGVERVSAWLDLAHVVWLGLGALLGWRVRRGRGQIASLQEQLVHMAARRVEDRKWLDQLGERVVEVERMTGVGPTTEVASRPDSLPRRLVEVSRAYEEKLREIEPRLAEVERVAGVDDALPAPPTLAGQLAAIREEVQTGQCRQNKHIAEQEERVDDALKGIGLLHSELEQRRQVDACVADLLVRHREEPIGSVRSALDTEEATVRELDRILARGTRS